MAEPSTLTDREYRQIVEHSSMMVWRADADGKLDYFNEVWLEFTGRTLAQELGEGWTGGVHPEDLDRFVKLRREHFERREPFGFEFRLRRHDGVYRTVVGRGVPVWHEGGFGGHIGSCVDVQERDDAVRAQAALLSMFAHELRTPLQSLVNYTEVFRQRLSGLPDLPEDVVDRFLRQVRRLGRLVTDLSHAARMEQGRRMAFEPCEVDLVGLVRDVAIHWGPRHPGKRHEVHVEGVRSAPVVADRGLLEQVVDSLLGNAVKYSPGGGRVTVSVEPDGAGYALHVRDQGIGIPRQELPRLTTRFFRASNASRANYPGVGLGLAIVDEIVQRHGGRLQFDSDEGQGTTVTVWLPAAGARTT